MGIWNPDTKRRSLLFLLLTAIYTYIHIYYIIYFIILCYNINMAYGGLDPAAGMMPGCPYPAISYLGRAYILLPDQRLLEPETEKIVGTFNRETNEIDITDPKLLEEALRNLSEFQAIYMYYIILHIYVYIVYV